MRKKNRKKTRKLKKKNVLKSRKRNKHNKIKKFKKRKKVKSKKRISISRKIKRRKGNWPHRRLHTKTQIFFPTGRSHPPDQPGATSG